MLTWAATIFHAGTAAPSSASRTQVWLWKPRNGVSLRTN